MTAKVGSCILSLRNEADQALISTGKKGDLADFVVCLLASGNSMGDVLGDARKSSAQLRKT